MIKLKEIGSSIKNLRTKTSSKVPREFWQQINLEPFSIRDPINQRRISIYHQMEETIK